MGNSLVFLFIFWVGGIVYQIIEILWSGRSHWTMFFVGGSALLLVYLIYNPILKETNILFFVLCCLIFTAIEFIAGCIINLWLKLKVWDYSSHKFNILGQICPKYSFYWLLLSVPAVMVCFFVDNFIFYEVF